MPKRICRVCGRIFFNGSLLQYENMPRAAQYLPDAESLESDEGVDLEVCQCSGCGLVQLGSEAVPYYREVIRAAAFSEEMRDFRVNQFEGFIQEYSLKGRKVLEIGCGRGEYLSLMQQCGADTYGLEYSEGSVIHCRKRGLKVSQGFVEDGDYRMEQAPFDAFFILNFLEHLPDPNAVLRGIYNNVTDDAAGLIEVPNLDMILRNDLFSEFISDHLLYFTRRTLETTLSLNGFEIIKCDEVWHDYIISAIVKRRKRLDLSRFYFCREKLKDDLEAYIQRYKDKGVAIWGAGHQALSVISLTGLAGRIRYIVDSATFKQGKFSPATHVPIVSPDALDLAPVDAVIVMAASYSDEVAGSIKHKYGNRINVAILRASGLEAASDEAI